MANYKYNSACTKFCIMCVLALEEVLSGNLVWMMSSELSRFGFRSLALQSGGVKFLCVGGLSWQSD